VELTWCKIVVVQLAEGIVKRLAICLLLAVLSLTCSAPAYAKSNIYKQQTRDAKKYQKRQQKAIKKQAKQQRKAQKRFLKAQKKRKK
jgi:hypothetical protein